MRSVGIRLRGQAGSVERQFAILTGVRRYGEDLRASLALFPDTTVRIVDCEPDLSFSRLKDVSVLILGSDLNRGFILMVLRALRMLQATTRCLLLAGDGQTVDGSLELLSNGVKGIVLDASHGVELPEGVEQVMGDNLYLSPQLILPMLDRYRELSAALRSAPNC